MAEFNVEENIKDLLSKDKWRKSVEIEGQSAYLSTWQSYYGGYQSSKFYKLNQNGKTFQCIKKSINMPKKVCENFSNFILNEKCDIIIPTSAKKNLDMKLKQSNFWVNANQYYEKAMALSMCAVVQGLKKFEIDENGTFKAGSGEWKARWVDATKIYPITVKDNEIIECAFYSANTNTNDLELHVLNEEGNYVIRSCSYDNENGMIPNSYFELDTMNNIKWFQIFSPNICNNLQKSKRLPISILSNNLDVFDSLDEIYNDFYEEFNKGRKRIFVNAKLWRVNDLNGDIVKTFDNNDTTFYSVEFDDNTKPLIESSADPLRDQSYINGINSNLNVLSSNLGLGKNFYNFNVSGESPKTATEVISMTSDAIRTIKKHEILVKNELINFVAACQYISNTFTSDGLGEFNLNEINVLFDDSIFEDVNSEQTRDRTNVASGLMSEVEFRMRWFGEDKKDAQKFINENLRYKVLNNYLSAWQTGALPTRLFITYCYPEYKEGTEEYNQLFNELEENKNKVVEPMIEDTFIG